MQTRYRLTTLVLLAIFCLQTLMGVNQTIVIIETGLPHEGETWFSSGLRNDLQDDQVKFHYDAGRVITSVGYGATGWLVTMAKTSEFTGQTYNFQSSWPQEWIVEMQKEGYAITQTAYGWGKWLVVMSRGTGLTSQVWATGTLAELNHQISEWWHKGYYLTSAAGLADGKWMVVASQGTQYASQAWALRQDWGEIESWIKKEKEAGYQLQMLECGQDGYLAVAYKYTDGRSSDQEFQIFDSSPKEYIQEGWNKGMKVLYVGGGSQPAEKKGAGRLPSEGETIYMGVKGGGTEYASVRCFRDGDGELRYDIYPSPTPEKGFYTYKHEDTKNGNFLLSRYHMTLKGKAIFGNQKWEARPDGYVVLISQADGTMIFPDGTIYNVPATFDKIKKGKGSKSGNACQEVFPTEDELGSSSEAVMEDGGAASSTTPSSASTSSTCSICNGSGVCTSCQGHKGSWKESGGSEEKVWVDCPSCKGTGRCVTCAGTGEE